jgi:DNA repair protein RecO (recombination protein O)
MTETAVYLQPAFILHQRKYRETSMLLDVFTCDFGKLSLLAKGVRKLKSKTAGLLQPFVPLAISYVGKSELKTLTHVEFLPPALELHGLAIYSGFYVNELINALLIKEDPSPEIFRHYRSCLTALAQGSLQEAALRAFEMQLLIHIGYGPALSYEATTGLPIDADKRYHFHAENGALEAENGMFSGKTLAALVSNEFSDPDIRDEAKQLMRTIIDFCLHGKTLKSRAILNSILKQIKV